MSDLLGMGTEPPLIKGFMREGQMNTSGYVYLLIDYETAKDLYTSITNSIRKLYSTSSKTIPLLLYKCDWSGTKTMEKLQIIANHISFPWKINLIRLFYLRKIEGATDRWILIIIRQNGLDLINNHCRLSRHWIFNQNYLNCLINQELMNVSKACNNLE